MNYDSFKDELNTYGKWLAHVVYLEYRDDFGVDDDLYLFSKTTDDFIQIKEEERDEVFIFQDDYLLCYPNSSSLKALSYENKLDYLKKLLPFHIFSFIIRPKYRGDVNYHEFMTKGLIEVYVESFSLKYNVPFVTQYLENKEFVLAFLQKFSSDISINKMVFQNDLDYMSEMYQIHTGQNIYKIYLDVSNVDSSRELVLNKSKSSSGFLHGMVVIISCISLGILFAIFVHFS